jgi:hypothetical protein
VDRTNEEQFQVIVKTNEDHDYQTPFHYHIRCFGWIGKTDSRYGNRKSEEYSKHRICDATEKSKCNENNHPPQSNNI